MELLESLGILLAEIWAAVKVGFWVFLIEIWVGIWACVERPKKVWLSLHATSLSQNLFY